MRELEVVVSEEGQRRDGDVVRRAVVGLPRVVMVDRRHLLWRVAVPLMHLVEEGGQAGRARDLRPCRAQQNAAREHTEDADDFRVLPDRWRLVLGTQQTALLQRGEIGQPPGVRISREVDQSRSRASIGKNRLAQLRGIVALALHELRPRHRRGRRIDVETERDVKRIAIVEDLLFRVGENPLQQAAHLVEGVVFALLVPGRACVVHGALEALEVARGDLLQAGIGEHAEAHAHVATCRHVQRVAGGIHQPVGVELGIETDPRDISALAVGLAADVRIEGYERQPKNLAVLTDLRCTELEVDVRRVNVREALQGDPVEAVLAGRHDPGSTQADGHVGLQRPLDQIPVRQNGLGPIRVDDLDVVETARSVAEIKRRDDGRRVDDLVARWRHFGDPRTHKLQQGIRLEAGPMDRHRDPAAVAALVLRDIRHLERQHLGEHLDRHVAARARTALHEDVVITSLRRGDEGRLISCERIFRRGIEGEAAREIVVADVELVGRC